MSRCRRWGCPGATAAVAVGGASRARRRLALWAAVVVALAGAGCIDLRMPAGRVRSADARLDARTSPASDSALAPDAAGDGAGDDDAGRGDPDGGPNGAGDAAGSPDDEPLPGSDAAAAPMPDAVAETDGAGASTTSDAGASDATPPADASPASACTLLFQDDFESGALTGWDRTYEDPPALVTTGAIAGARSLSTRLGNDNAAGRTFAPTSKLRLTFMIDLATMTTTGSIPMLAALRGSNLSFNPVSFYFGRGANGPQISVRANLDSDTFERISFASLPASRVQLQLDWQAATGATRGSVQLHVDGGLFWTSPPLDNPVTVDEVRLGNTGSSGSGTALFDGVVVERCP
jgi:hypothetical protein